jgi:hypothetical protein
MWIFYNKVQSFNGCGFCKVCYDTSYLMSRVNDSSKWARTNPSPKHTGYSNPGSPGCCRAPMASEQRMITAADWPAVSMIHHVPIPPEIKSLLDSLRGGPIPALTTGVGRSTGSSSSMPSSDRRNSGNSSPKSPSSGSKALPMPIPSKRTGETTKQTDSSIASPSFRACGTPSSLPKASTFEHQRRHPGPESVEKRTDVPHSSHSSPIRKTAELEGVFPKRDSGHRLSVSNNAPTIVKPAVDSQTTPPLRRRSSSSNMIPQIRKSSPPVRSTDRPSSAIVKTQTRRGSSEGSEPSSSISSASSSSGSSDSLGSLTDSTITTDGGFTDYLSEESEEELQRQAEAKAILVAQTQAEEQEFKAARQQLANVDLRPPKSWNPQARALRLE